MSQLLKTHQRKIWKQKCEFLENQGVGLITGSDQQVQFTEKRKASQKRSDIHGQLDEQSISSSEDENENMADDLYES